MPTVKPITITSKTIFPKFFSTYPGPTVDTTGSPTNQFTVTTLLSTTQSQSTHPSLPHPNPPKPSRDTLHGVNLIRILLTIWIFYFHFQVFFRNTTTSSPNYNKNGGFAVELFFILSGFVLTFVYLDSFKCDKPFWTETAKFLAKRFFRIWPVHVLFTYLFYVYTPECQWDQFVLQVTLRTWKTEDSILQCNVPAWFVHQELYLCLALPFVLWLLNRHRLGVVAVLAVACGSWYIYIQHAFPLWDETFREAVMRAIPTFTTGVLLGWLYNQNKTVSNWFDLAALPFLVQFLRILEGPVLGQEQFLLRTVLLFIPIVYCVSRGRIINFLADNTFIRTSSTLCFNFFMFQWFILDTGKRTSFGLEPNFIYKSFKYVWPAFALFTLAWAAVFYYAVEEKLTQIAHLFCKWLDQRLVKSLEKSDIKLKYEI